MGTNYYLKSDVCPHCGRGEDAKHIGKSSAGWCFSLHVYPEDGINNLEDWKAHFSTPSCSIEDEYGVKLNFEQMIERITERAWKQQEVPYGYDSWSQFHEMNHSQAGPNGLVRHRIEKGHCIGHGEGTWDLIIGEFS